MSVSSASPGSQTRMDICHSIAHSARQLHARIICMIKQIDWRVFLTRVTMAGWRECDILFETFTHLRNIALPCDISRRTLSINVYRYNIIFWLSIPISSDTPLGNHSLL